MKKKGLNTLLDRIYFGGMDADKTDIIDILETDSNGNLTEILEYADKVREAHLGGGTHLRGIVEIGNACDNGCFYCGLRKENKSIDRYRLTEKEIMESVDNVFGSGVKTVILQSGEEKNVDYKKVSRIIEKIKTKYGMAVTLSLGEAGYDILKEWRKSGADRYLLKIETTEKTLFEKIRPGRKIKDRLKCIDNLFKLGYEVGSGNIVGLPGQTVKDLADDLIYFGKKKFDMISISPLIVHPNTPLLKMKKTNRMLPLKVLALARIITRDANIPATTAFETLGGNLRKQALKSGANVIMISFTPLKYKAKYEIYPNRFGGCKTAEYSIEKTKYMIKELKRSISTGYGSRFENFSFNLFTKVV